MKVERFTLLAFLFVGWCGAIRAESEQRIERMTDLVVSMLPQGTAFDDLAAESSEWPLNTYLANIDAGQLACARGELSSTGLRKRKLAEVTAYATDAKRFAADFALLNGGLAESFHRLIEEQAAALRNGTEADLGALSQEILRQYPSELDQLASDPGRQGLRRLLEFVTVPESGAAAAIAQLNDEPRRAVLRRDLARGLENCNLPLPPALAAMPEARTSVTFAAQCSSDAIVPDSADMKNVTAPRPDPAHPLSMPEYPPAARQAGDEGTSMIQVFVTDSGAIGQARLQESSGFVRLDNAALDGAGNWHLVPGRVKKKAACIWVTIPVVFKLTDDPAPTGPAPGQ